MIQNVDLPPTPVISTRETRKTENTDTRQALQHHDPEYYKKKKEDGEGGFKDAYEDLTDVSVPALRNFLLGLLDRSSGDAAPPVEETRPEVTRTPVSPQAAHAMDAYKSGAARGVAPPTPPPPRPEPESRATALDEAAAGLDREIVLGLIRDLDLLAAQGIASIALEKGDGFLDSIRKAVNKALGL